MKKSPAVNLAFVAAQWRGMYWVFPVSAFGTVGPVVLMEGFGVYVQSDSPTELSASDPVQGCIPFGEMLSCIIVKGRPAMPKRKKAPFS
jgi:hypothetical protein